MGRILNTQNIAVRYALITLGVLIFYRLVFIGVFVFSAPTFSSLDFLKAFYLGVKFDLRLVSILSVIPLICSFFHQYQLIIKTQSYLWRFIQFIIAILIAFDLGTYFYVNSRISAAVAKFLDGPTATSLEMIWQNYPVVLIFIFLFLHLWLLVSVEKKFILSKLEQFHFKWQQLVVLFFLHLFLFYGKFSWYPLRWSEAFFTPNTFISALALNPVLYFVETWKFAKESDMAQLTDVAPYYEEMKRYLGMEASSISIDNSKGPYFREERKLPSSNVPNVVIIVLESQAAFKSGILGSPINPTPHLDKIAQNGQIYSQFYVPTQATARSMFTLVTGLPDLTQVKTGTRNPFLVDHHSIISNFESYQKMYFLGGSASWGNIRGIFANNIPELRIFEEGDFSAPRVDVWGISDFDLLDFAFTQLENAQNRDPVFAIIQTSGFHRPYSIPKAAKEQGFELETSIPLAELQKAGFDSLEEYNSLRWQDFALGNFYQKLKGSSFFNNTLLVVYGDHGLPAQRAQHVPEFARHFDLENFHVPLVLHYPGVINPGKIDTLTSQLDLLPSLAHLAGVSYQNTTFGRNIFDPKFSDRNEVFVYYWYMYPPQYGIYDGNFFYKENGDQLEELFLTTSQDFSTDVSTQYQDKKLQLQKLAKGFYFSAKYLMANNKKGFKK